MQTKPAGTHRHAHTTKEADRQSPRIATTKTAAEHPTITQLQDVRAPLVNRVAVLQGARPQRFGHVLQDAETVAGGDREPTGGQRRTFSASFGSFSTNCVTQYASCWWNALMFRGLCSGMSAFCKNVLCSSCWPSWTTDRQKSMRYQHAGLPNSFLDGGCVRHEAMLSQLLQRTFSGSAKPLIIEPRISSSSEMPECASFS